MFVKRINVFLFLGCLMVAAKAQESLNIVFVGNSITYGYKQKNHTVTCPPARCAQWLGEQQSVSSVHYRNMGKSGKASYNFLPRPKTYYASVVRDMQQLDSLYPKARQVFSIKLGTNDTPERPNRPATTPEQYKQNICRIIDSLHAAFPKAVFILHRHIWFSPNIMTKNGSVFNEESLQRLEAFRQTYQDIIRQRADYVFPGDTLAYDYFKETHQKTIVHETGTNGETYFLHPNEAGAEQLGVFWGKAILRALGLTEGKKVVPHTRLDINITTDGKARMTAFLPEKPTGKAVICCPGGGYKHLAFAKEGTDWAPFFNEMGIALFVLQYRMPAGHRDVPMADAQNAIRIVRENARQWHINSHDVGIMGFSAGGHLASTIATHAPKELRPDFQLLFYPVISMDSTKTHKGSVMRFLGDDKANPELIREYSNHLNVDAQTPPALIIYALNDRTVRPQYNGKAYYEALVAAHIPAKLIEYNEGKHGFGYNSDFIYHNEMLEAIRKWLQP